MAETAIPKRLVEGLSGVLDVVTSSGIVLPSNDAVYIGDPSTDGTIRFTNDSGGLVIASRVSGSYVIIGTFSPP